VGAPAPDIQNMLSAVDPELDEEPPPQGWSVLILLDQAMFMAGKTWPGYQRLADLQVSLQARAQQWGSLSAALLDKPPLEPESLERLIDQLIGFQNPVQWRAQMQQRERTVCRIEFKINGENKAQGTGFLLGPSLDFHHPIKT